jgi:hypothetical protein
MIFFAERIFQPPISAVLRFMKKNTRFRIAAGIAVCAMQFIVPSACLGASYEYLFSGPEVSGRFIVEGYSVSTPDPNDIALEWALSGSPYFFTATAGGSLTLSTDMFDIGVWNNFVAFGRSDSYALTSPELELLFMGPTLVLPVTTSLPHDLEDYSGLHWVRMWDGGAGNWREFQVTSLTPVPEPGTLLLALMAGGCLLLMRPGMRRRALSA